MATPPPLPCGSGHPSFVPERRVWLLPLEYTRKSNKEFENILWHIKVGQERVKLFKYCSVVFSLATVSFVSVVVVVAATATAADGGGWVHNLRDFLGPHSFF